MLAAQRSFKASYDMLMGDTKKSSARNPTMKEKGYTEVKRIGKGSFGMAMLVLREETREHFVAKYMKFKTLEKEQKEFMLREVQTMHHISCQGSHPYIVQFRESFVTSSGLLCIIMDYCDSSDMAHLIATQKKRSVPFTEEQVHLWLLQLLSALNFLHSCDVLHRDIKPANVFMNAGCCKLADFGLSKQVLSAYGGRQAHTQCGSPLYLAPEVHMGRKYDRAVDMWSLGCTLFEIMMLSHAFVGADHAEILKNIAWGRHAPIAGSWSNELKAILKRMLVLKASDRPSALDVMQQPMFAPALHANSLHPEALAHVDVKERLGMATKTLAIDCAALQADSEGNLGTLQAILEKQAHDTLRRANEKFM